MYWHIVLVHILQSYMPLDIDVYIVGYVITFRGNSSCNTSENLQYTNKFLAENNFYDVTVFV